MRTYELHVDDMRCEGCARAVRSAIERVDGVGRVDVSLDEKEARITAGDEVTAEDLVAAIGDAGYTASRRD